MHDPDPRLRFFLVRSRDAVRVSMRSSGYAHGRTLRSAGRLSGPAPAEPVRDATVGGGSSDGPAEAFRMPVSVRTGSGYASGYGFSAGEAPAKPQRESGQAAYLSGTNAETAAGRGAGWRMPANPRFGSERAASAGHRHRSQAEDEVPVARFDGRVAASRAQDDRGEGCIRAVAFSDSELLFCK